MPYVGYTGVANQVNTTDGFGLGVGAANVPVTNGDGENVGANGVVDLYHDGVVAVKYYIADETSPGYVLQEDSSKITLESS